MTMRKADVISPRLVMIILMLLVFILIMISVWPLIETALQKTGATAECDISMLAKSLSKEVLVEGLFDIPLNCKSTRAYYTEKDFDSLTPLAQERINIWNKNPDKYPDIIKHYPNTDKAYTNRWIANKIIADALINGWNKVARGAFKKELSTAGELCIITERIYLPEELELTEVDETEYTSWLANTPYKTGKSYYEELEGQDIPPTFYSYNPDYGAEYGGEDLAITYIIKAEGGAGALFKEPMQGIGPVRFSELEPCKIIVD